MSDNFFNIKQGFNADPKDADPTNPREGDHFFASGNHPTRAKGLYNYKDGVWNLVGSGGVGSPSIYGLLNAEDRQTTGWTVSAGTLVINDTTQLNGDASYQWTPASALDTLETADVEVPVRARAKEFKFRFVYSASENFNIQVRVSSDNSVLGNLNCDANKNEAEFIGVIPDGTTQVFYWIESGGTSPIIIDDLYLDSDVFEIESAYYLNSVRLVGNSGQSISAGNDVPYSGSGTGWSGTTYTVQKNDSVIEIKGGAIFTSDASRFPILAVNGSPNIGLVNRTVSNTGVAMFDFTSSKGQFSAGDTLSIRNLSGTLSNNSSYHYLNINETIEDTRLTIEDSQFEWNEVPSINLTATGGGLSKGTTSVDRTLWRRDGQDMLVRYEYQQTNSTGAAAGSGNYLFEIPGGFEIDTDLVTDSGAGNEGAAIVGTAKPNASFSDTRTDGHAIVYNSTNLAMVIGPDPISTSMRFVSSSFFSVGGGTRGYYIDARVPIKGWGSNSTVSVPVADKINSLVGLTLSGATKDPDNVFDFYDVTLTATGIYTYTLKNEMAGLTVNPDVNIQPYGTNRMHAVGSLTTSGFIVYIYDRLGNLINQDHSITVTKRGADWTNPESYFIGQVAQNKVQTKILQSNPPTGTDVEMTDLTFTDLVPGKWYEFKLQVYLVVFSGGGTIAKVTDNAGDIKGVASFDGTAAAAGSTRYTLNQVFKAEDNVLKFLSTASGSDFIVGSGSKQDTFVQVIERNDLYGVDGF